MISDAEAFEYLKIELKETVLSHPIIQRNRYLWWFSQTTDLTKEDLIKELQKNVVSCKDVHFTFLGFSLATINTIISLILSAITLKIFINYEKY